MPNFDINHWYQLVTKNTLSTQSMVGTTLYSQNKGAVFFQNTNTTLGVQQWQLFPYNSSFFVLRTKDSGPEGYMDTAIYAPDLDTPVPIICVAAESDDSMFWQMGKWGDGTYYFTNKANGSSWHFEDRNNSLMQMSAHISSQTDAQSFESLQLGSIDDARFSTVVVNF